MKKYLIVLAAAVVALASCNNNGAAKYTSIAFEESTITVGEGATGMLQLVWEPSSIKEAPVCVWSSSDTSVVFVDQDGNIEALAIGEANITATYGEGEDALKAVCKIIVKDPLDIIAWGGWSLWNLDRTDVLSNDTLVTTLSTGEEVRCVMVSAVYSIWDDNIAMNPQTGDMSGVGYFADVPGTVWLITDSLDKNGANHYYLGSNFFEIKDFDTFDWHDTANVYCGVTGKLGDAQKHLEWYNDSTSTRDDVTELEGGIINAVNWNTGRYAGLFFGLVGEGVFANNKISATVTECLYKANFSWFAEDDVAYGLKFVEVSEGEWEPKDPAEWGALTPKHYEYLGQTTTDAVGRQYTIKEFIEPKQDAHKFGRPTDVLIKK